MDISTAQLDQAVAGVRALEGVETRDLGGAQLHEAIVAACEVLSAARRLAAPVAAAVARDAGGAGVRGGITRQAGHRSPEQFIAQLLGGTVSDARTLIGAGLAMDPDELPAVPGAESGEADGGASNLGDSGGIGASGGTGDSGGIGASGGTGDSGGTGVLGGAAGSGDAGGAEDSASRGLGIEPPCGPAHPENSQAAPPRPRALTPGSLAESLGRGAVAVDAAALIRSTLGELTGVVDAPTLWEIEKRLVQKATRMRLYDLRKACWRERATADPSGWREREKRMRARRVLTIAEDADGMVTLTARLDALSAAPIRAWFDAQTKAAFRCAREAGVPEVRTAGQIRVDAFAALAAHGLDCDSPGSGVKTTVMVTIDADALATGLGLASCDGIATPITAATARHMAVEAEILPAVCNGESEVLDLGRAQRLFSRAQRRALSLRDGGCAWCDAPVAWTEVHHIEHWVRDRGCTDLCNGILLCRSCHLRLHDTGWEVEIHDGTAWFRPPASVDPQRRAIVGGRRRTSPETLPAPPPLPTGPRPRLCSGNHLRT